MKVMIITQDEPYYLADAIKHLLTMIGKKHQICGCVLLAPSPFGKKESFFEKSFKTLKIFGPAFFTRYSVKYIVNRFKPSKMLSHVLGQHGVSIIRLQHSINNPISLNTIKAYEPDLLVSIAGNEIFRAPLINLAPKGCINLHTALLPKYRGLFPTFWVLKNHEIETGVSVFLVDDGIDNGPILVQKRIHITNQTLEDLIIESKRIGMEAVAEAIELLALDRCQFIANDRSQMTYFRFPTRVDVKAFLAAGNKFF